MGAAIPRRRAHAMGDIEDAGGIVAGGAFENTKRGHGGLSAASEGDIFH